MPTTFDPNKYTLEEINRIASLSPRTLPSATDFADILRTDAFSKKHKKYSSINILQGNHIPEHLYRYISYTHLEDAAKRNKLAFISPEVWQDPFEKRFLKTDYSKYSYKQPYIFCMCTTENSCENEDAAWRLRETPNDKVLRVKFNVDKLLSNLNSYSIQSGMSVYIGRAIYAFSRKDIMAIHTSENEFYHKQYFFEPFTDTNYLSLMLLKQDAYEYENEVRIFCCTNSLPEDEDKIFVDVDIQSVIEEIDIAPLYPFPTKDPRVKYFKAYNDLDNNAYSAALKSIFPNIPIKQSEITIVEQLDKA